MNVSVLVPTFDRAAVIGSTIESLFCQTIPPHEVIVVDDGSTDDTRAVVEALSARTGSGSSRLRYLRQDNAGKSVALNRALGAVSPESDWIAFDDSDDLWRPDKLERQLAVLAAFPRCGGCFTDAVYVNHPAGATTAFGAAGTHLHGPTGQLENAVPILARLSHGIYMQTVIVRAAVMRRVGPFDPALRVAQDVDFLFRLGLETPLCYVNAPLVDIDRTPRARLRLTSGYQATSRHRLMAHDSMFRKWLDIVGPDQRALRRLIDRQLQDTISAMINRHVLENDPIAARETAARAFVEHRAWRFGAKWLLLKCLPPHCLRRLAQAAETTV